MLQNKSSHAAAILRLWTRRGTKRKSDNQNRPP